MSSLPSPDKIVFDAVSCSFELAGRPFLAVDRVSLAIADGEFVTLVGPSGCGKSTLMNLAAGLLEPSAGEVRLDGRAIAGPSPERGVIFQQYALFPWLTVSQNIEFGLTIKHTPKPERDAIVRKCLELVGLT